MKIYPRRYEVTLSHHALQERWPERVGEITNKKKLLAKIRQRLNDQIIAGLPINNAGAAMIDLDGGVIARLVLDGREFVVVTVLKEGAE